MPHAFKLAHRLSRYRTTGLSLILSLAACSSSDSLTASGTSQESARNRRIVTVTPAIDTVRVGASTQLTATVMGGYGQWMAGAIVTWTSSDTMVATVTASGLTKGSRVGSATVSATSAGYTGSAKVVVTPVSGCGSAGSGVTIDSVSRDVGSAIGGTAVAIYGLGFLASDCALFGPRPGKVDSVRNGVMYTHTPADTSVTVSDVVSIAVQQNGHRTVAGDRFDYEPALKTTFVTQDFENRTIAPFHRDLDATGAVAIDSTYAHSGRISVKCSNHPNAPITIARLYSTFGTMLNAPLNSPSGVYQRWYVLVPQYTLDSSAAGQIKLHLERVDGTQPPPGWLMLGEGVQFESNPRSEVVAFGDYGIFNLPGGFTKSVLRPGSWMEIETWYKRTPGLGHAKLWINGQLKVDTTSINFGSDNPNDLLTMYIGLVYAQALTGQVALWIDDAAAADGFLE